MAERTPPPPARDKLTFLLAFVPYLIDHGRVSVQEAARQFGVTDAQVRDAVRLIAVSGVPGDTAAYQHDDLFDIAWDDFENHDQIVLTHMVAIDDTPRFSRREAAALIAGLQYVSALPEHADRRASAGLMAKLSRGSSGTPNPVAVEATETDTSLALIREAVSSGRQIEFTYRNSAGESEHRRVDPLRVESVDADWYLRGWCHLRQAPRTFRIDRIGEPAISDATITYRPHDVELPETLFEASPNDHDIELSIAPAALPLVADYLEEDSIVRTDEGAIGARMRVPHLHGVKRLVCAMPHLITVTAPPEARQIVAEWAAAGARRYADSSPRG